MRAAVRTGRAHLGVSAIDVIPDDLITTPVATYPQVLLIPDGRRLARRRVIRLADLAGAELVVPRRAARTGSTWNARSPPKPSPGPSPWKPKAGR